MPDFVISDTSFLKELRHQTAGMHERLEQLPLSLLLTTPQLTLQDYICYLQNMYAVHTDAEKNIYPILKDVISDISTRVKSGRIKADMSFLNADLQRPHFSFLQPADEYSVDFALGIIYVLEGSTLGGRFILKNVEKTLHLNEDNGASYFAGYKHLTGEKWKAFISSMMNYQSKSNNNGLSIINGAKHAFNSIYNLMNCTVHD